MSKVVELSSINDPIKPSPGFAKKHLSTFKLDIMGLCEFGCLYCSSNSGNFLRVNRKRFQKETERQLGEPLLPTDTPDLLFVWPDILQRLADQLDGKPRSWGTGQTLVFSMLTDGFSPYLVKHGITRRALEMVLEHTSFRVRVLTKNAVVGSSEWLDFFGQWQSRVVVGLSIGSHDNEWARRIEKGASLPSARIKALHRLQDAEIPTFGMMCPIFPCALADGALEALIESLNPDKLETVWAEPFNDRSNWIKVRSGYDVGHVGYQWLTDTYERGDSTSWSRYATNLYDRLIKHGEGYGWAQKLKFLLYEGAITAQDAARMAPFRHILMQGTVMPDGRSKNDDVSQFQQVAAI